MPRRPLYDRLLAVLALFACLSFLVGLRDVRTPPLRAGATVPPAPEVDDYGGPLRVVVRSCAPQGKSEVAGPDTPCADPLPSARVTAFWGRERQYYRAGEGSTGPEGVAELTRLPRGETWIVVDAPGRARRSTRVVVDAEPRTVELTLSPEHSLLVEVEDERGQPIPSASVLIETRDPLPFGALTEADGQANVGRLPQPPWIVRASAPGFESVTQRDVVGPVRLRLRRLGSIEVLCRDARGAPVPGATVLIAGTRLWPTRRLETGDDGRRQITGLLEGTYDLKAMKGGLVSATTVAVELSRGARETVTLQLVPGRMVTALVTDGEGDSPLVVPNADVVLLEDGISAFPLRGRTGSDGTVVLGPITTGPASLSASAPEFVPRAAVPVPEPLDGPVRVALLRGGTIEGRVLDARDFPVDGVTIEVIGSDQHGLPVAETPLLTSFRSAFFSWGGPMPLIPAGELGVMPGPIPAVPRPGSSVSDPGVLTWAEPSASRPFEFEAAEPWVTRADGSFVARPVTPGRLRVIARHPGYVEGVSELVTVAPGGRAEVKIVLRAGGTLEGVVVDPRGQWVAGARVDLAATRGSLQRTVVTASDGSFAFAAVPEEVTLLVSRPEQFGRVALRQVVQVAEGRRTEVRITLPAPRESVDLVVLGERDAPVVGAQVAVLSLDPATPLRQTQFTDDAGRITLEDARGLPARVLVEAPGFARLTRDVQALPAELRLPLVHGVRIEGRVTTRRGRDPVPDASVSVVSEGLRKLAMTDAEGRYALDDVPTSEIELAVTHPAFAEARERVKVSATGRADRAFEVPDIDLPEPGSVEGRVLDERGQPVLGARVARDVVPSYLPAGALPPGMASTNAAGEFKLNTVKPGPAAIEAYAPGVGRGRATVEVVSGRAATVTIRLQPTDEDDDVPAAASVAVTLGERGSGADLEVVVVLVARESEAERAGLLPGDVIRAVDGVRPSSMADARERLSGPPTSDVVIEVEREGGPLRYRLAREAVRR